MRRGAALLLVGASTLAAPVSVRAGDACESAHVMVQRSRRGGRLRDARRSALACGAETCGQAVRADCVRWVDEIDALLPTVVFDARGPDGAEISDVTVSIAAETIATRLDGKHVEVDPGEFVVRYQRGDERIEQRVIFREGEKLRTLRVRFGGAGAAASASAVAPPVSAPPPAPQSSSSEPAAPAAPRRAPPTAAFVAAGAGALAIGVGSYLALSGLSRERALRDDCGTTHSCSHDDVSALRRRYVTADVAFALGALGFAAAGVLWVAAPRIGADGAVGANFGASGRF